MAYVKARQPVLPLWRDLGYIQREQEQAMLDLIFVALFQAASGQPEAQPAETPAEAAQQTAAAQAQPAQPRMRCRLEPITGSRLMRRVCLTTEQQQEIEDESRDLTTRAQSQLPLIGN